jgi:rhomboid family GlyGly-CTERM serine protease
LLQKLLIYDRAAIGDGEVWRLLTGNLVHYSGQHLAYNMVPLLIAGALIEIQRHGYFLVLCVAAGTLIGAALYAGKPEIVIFAGLSGIVTAAVTYLCLHGLGKRGAWRWLCLAVLICLALKIGVELALGSSFLFVVERDFVVVPESHAVGVVTALLMFLRDTHTGRSGSRRSGSGFVQHQQQT